VFDRYNSDKAKWEYDIVAAGFKYNMTDTAAAMGLVQLQRADTMQARRAEIAARYNEEFAGLPVDLPSMNFKGEHSWHLYQIGVESRDGVIDHLFSAGIGASVHFKPLHLMEYWSQLTGRERTTYTGAEACYRKSVSLPIFSAMTDVQVNQVIEAVRGYYEH
jgi:dTDP-4-amino-4,6-dideoxygalactose transaminase